VPSDRSLKPHKPVTILYNICVPETLLQTKLYVPPLRPNIVSRPRLIERLNQGLQLGHRLTLVSAPAGATGGLAVAGRWR